ARPRPPPVRPARRRRSPYPPDPPPLPPSPAVVACRSPSHSPLEVLAGFGNHPTGPPAHAEHHYGSDGRRLGHLAVPADRHHGQQHPVLVHLLAGDVRVAPVLVEVDQHVHVAAGGGHDADRGPLL